MKFRLIIFLLVFTGHLAWSQSDQDRYLNGKELYRLEKYNLAMEAFEPLINQGSDNPFVEYASFFYALSAYHAGKLPMAKNMFLQIKSKFPRWNQLDEVNFWLGQIYFENRQFGLALTTLNDINSSQLEDPVRDMKMFFLDKIASVDSIYQIYQDYADDPAVGKVLADKIMEQPLVKRDMELIQQLVDKFNLNQDQYNIIRPDRSVKKDEYRIAVLLPFMYQSVASTNATRKNFVYELYEGVKMARDQLVDQGVNIRLFAYDTKKDSSVTARLLQKEEMAGMDLIIGPVSSETIDVVNSFSYEHKINMFNPVSTNSKIIGNNPYSYLFLPTQETQARQTAEFMDSRVSSPRTLIYYGESQRDSLLAFNYSQALQDLGLRVNQMRQIDRSSAKSIFDFLTSTNTIITEDMEEKDEYVIARDSIGHIFVASDSDDGMIAANLISAIETRQENLPIVGSEDWLDYSFVIPEQLERLNVHLIAPSFFDLTSERYKQFRENYLSRTYTLPSRFSSLGYDMMMFLGNMLYEHGIYFQVAFDDIGFQPGTLLPGYRFDGFHDNQYVPIVHFKESELININQPQ